MKSNGKNIAEEMSVTFLLDVIEDAVMDIMGVDTITFSKSDINKEWFKENRNNNKTFAKFVFCKVAFPLLLKEFNTTTTSVIYMIANRINRSDISVRDYLKKYEDYVIENPIIAEYHRLILVRVMSKILIKLNKK